MEGVQDMGAIPWDIHLWRKVPHCSHILESESESDKLLQHLCFYGPENLQEFSNLRQTVVFIKVCTFNGNTQDSFSFIARFPVICITFGWKHGSCHCRLTSNWTGSEPILLLVHVTWSFLLPALSRSIPSVSLCQNVRRLCRILSSWRSEAIHTWVCLSSACLCHF